MLRYILTFFCALLLATGLQAQAYDYPERDDEETIYIPGGFIGLSTGINNFNGMLGVNAEALIFRNFTLAGGAGLGGWGWKFSGAGRYYLNYPKGVFFAVGYSMATGIENISLELETTSSDEKEFVELNLYRVHNLNISSGIQWRLGKRFRLALEYGYSMPLQEQAWEVVSPYIELTDESEQILEYMIPGGIIIGFGFTYGIQ